MKYVYCIETGFFMKLQQLGGAKVVESSDLGMGVAKGVEPASVVKYSQCYRSALKECVMGLKSELKSKHTKEKLL